MKAAIAAFLAAASTVVCTAGSAQSSDVRSGSRVAPRTGGIWKAAVPPKPMTGEFDSMDPLGIAAGAWIKADCSLNWIDPDGGAMRP